jgi:hypothetical protein
MGHDCAFKAGLEQDRIAQQLARFLKEKQCIIEGTIEGI